MELRLSSVPGLRCWLALVALFLVVPLRSHCQDTNMSSVARGRSRDVFGYDPTADFLLYDPQYRERHARYATELRALQLELARQSANGRATPCSRQIFLE